MPRQRSRLWFLWVIALLTLGAVLRPSHALACSCSGQGSVETERDASDAIFVGHVVSVKLNTRWVPASGDRPADCGTRIVIADYKLSLCQAEDVVVSFEVLKSWKGVDSDEVTLRTDRQSTACGFSFAVGQIYLVYAKLEAQRGLATSSCSRTALWSAAQKDQAVLGAPRRDFISERESKQSKAEVK